ncbi:MAG: DUF6563 family protein [Bacteroidota bacterium]
MKNIFLTILLLISQFSYAKDYVLSLSQVEVSLNEKSYQLKSVVDARTEKANIGWVQKGLSNRKVFANFAMPFDKEIKNFLSNNLNTSNDVPAIHALVERLYVSEKTGFSKEWGYADLIVRFILQKDGKFYNLIRAAYQSEIRKGADITKRHPENIGNAFKACFEQLDSVDLTDTDQFEPFEDIEAITSAIDELVAINTEVFNSVKDGVYENFQEVLAKAPSYSGDLKIEKKERKQENWEGTYDLKVRYGDSNKKLKDIWGFAQDGVLYVKHLEFYFELIATEKELYFYGYGVPNTQAVNTGAIIGGAIGGGIAAASESARMKKQKIKYLLDPQTGGIMNSYNDSVEDK